MTHFADVEYKAVGLNREILPLPIGHQWVCNASLPSWATILLSLSGFDPLQLPSIYLCKDHAVELGLEW
jgi:hypothetical protein